MRILKDNVLCSIATVTKYNRAHNNTAYFCWSRDLDLYFLSDPASLHCRNLKTNSSLAVTVFNSTQKWGRPDCGLQLFGVCGEANAGQAEQAERLYGKRFAGYAGWRQTPRYRFYRFVPSRVELLDEGEFGAGVFISAAVKSVGL